MKRAKAPRTGVRPLTPQLVRDVAEFCATRLGVTAEGILGQSQRHDDARARVLMMALLLHLSGSKLESVGSAVGRSHATVASARQRISALRLRDERFARIWALALESFGMPS